MIRPFSQHIVIILSIITIIIDGQYFINSYFFIRIILCKQLPEILIKLVKFTEALKATPIGNI